VAVGKAGESLMVPFRLEAIIPDKYWSCSSSMKIHPAVSKLNIKT
jgi:hypothetical protein